MWLLCLFAPEVWSDNVNMDFRFREKLGIYFLRIGFFSKNGEKAAIEAKSLSLRSDESSTDKQNHKSYNCSSLY